MKAIIEENDGMYIIRIYEHRGSLCDVYVVEEIELKGENECLEPLKERSNGVFERKTVSAGMRQQQ